MPPLADIFFELHSGLPREAPGDDESTKRAFSLLTSLPSLPVVLDIGCGPGAQTLVLARESRGFVVAFDNHKPFLDELRRRSLAAGLHERIHPFRGSLYALPFRASRFDLIWSEGAIYLLGYERGLREWKPFLRNGGYLAVTEMSWIVSNPPQEPLEFWKSAYPGMNSLEKNLDIATSCGYDLVGNFILPTESWWIPYYRPLAMRIRDLKRKYRGNPEAQALLDQEGAEIALFESYSHTYGYVFYILRKNRG